MKKMIFIITIIFLSLLFIIYFLPITKPAKKITWGINFAQFYAQSFGLNWKETYLKLIEELNVKNIKILTAWNLIEPEKNKFYFDDIKWQIEKANEKDIKLILVLGMKTGRWPECHLPDFAKKLNKEELQKEILELLRKEVDELKGYKNIVAWQVENEPFLNFGECPFYNDKNFLEKEVKLVKEIDPQRPIIISESGELSFWTKGAQIGDILSITLYRKVWQSEFKKYFVYPLSPNFYYLKAKAIEKIFSKKVICSELQGEPWGKSNLLYNFPIEEQLEDMTLKELKNNINFAKKTGLDTFYFWGAEWWYFLKEHGHAEYYEEMKSLF
ncbi:MAG: hypothetical protein ACP5H7_01985 [Minisyncoccia bacterium]